MAFDRDNPQDLLHLARMAELGMLTASLLHELRQPLFAIKGLAQLTRTQVEGAPAERLKELLEHLRHVEELVGYYGDFGVREEPELLFDLNECVRQAVAMMQAGRRRAARSSRMALISAATSIVKSSFTGTMRSDADPRPSSSIAFSREECPSADM